MSHVPELRFSEFDGNYKKHLFENIFLFSTGKNIKQNEASPEYKMPCVRYGELYHLYDEVITQVVNKTNLNESELTFSEGNEILLPSAGEDPIDIGSASALTLKNIAIGRTINILRPKEENAYSQIYVSYYINQKLRKRISTLARGVSISNVYNSDLKTLTINLPSLPEQQKIATFLSAVDKKLGHLRRKHVLLENYKRGVASALLSTGMQKQAQPELRFKQDDGTDFPDWEEKRLGDVAKYYDGTHQTPKYVEKGIPFYSVEHVTANQFSTTKYISEEVFEHENKRVKLEKGDILMTRIGSIGVAKYLDWDVNASFYVSLAMIKSNESYDSKFLSHLINSTNFQKKLWKRTIHVAFPKKINLGEIGNCNLSMPCKEEQQKIANFLSTLDKKLESVQSQINQTEKFKKGLLQKMFV